MLDHRCSVGDLGTLLSSQRLFDSGRGAGDLLAHDSFLDRARSERERDNDAGARRALGAYLVVRLVDRLLELEEESEESAQGFAWQLEGCRRFIADLGEDSETSHLRGIIDAVNVDPAHRHAVVRVSLSAYAYFLEHEGRWADALDVLRLASRLWGEPIPPRELAALSLFAGRLNRLLARWDVATEAYSLAEEAATVAGDTFSALRARLGQGAVMRGQGNLPRARETAERVIEDAAGDPALADVQGMAYADLGAVLARLGLRIEALQAIYEGFCRAQDPHQRNGCLGDLGITLSELGTFDAARTALELVLDGDANFRLHTNARLELMQVESAVGNRVAFERHRGAVRKVADQLPPSMAVDFRYKSGIGLSRFGQTERARALWEEGRALAEVHQLNEWYFKLDRLLASIDQSAECLAGSSFTQAELHAGADAVVAEIGAGLLQAKALVHA
jgi:tetratricopeptide (TPR) repeat protein